MITDLVIGASSGIAQAVIIERLKRDNEIQILCVSRQPDLPNSLDSQLSRSQRKRVLWFDCDYQQTSIHAFCLLQAPRLIKTARVFICNGILHEGEWMPERKIEDLSQDVMSQVMQVNAIIPMLWIKNLRAVLALNRYCQLVCFSARIGSIGDNRLGGWYSYRASKAALNMLVKTASIEFSRRAKNMQLILFHPGTTDTSLSKPFQKNVPAGKLFTAEFVAKQLLEIINDQAGATELRYLDWQGEVISW